MNNDYKNPSFYFIKSITCVKSTIFTINEIKNKKCLDGTYVFTMIGTLSKNVDNNINKKIYIRDKIKNDIEIYCNNLSYYGFISNIDHYSFDCYVVNDILDDNLTITLLNTPPSSDLISIHYSPYFNYNENIYFNFKCNILCFE